MSKINICFSSDNNYAKYMGTAICSILKNAGKEDSYNFYILDGGISDKSKEEISKLKEIKDFSIEYLTVNPDDFKSCPMTGYVNYITLPTYYRFKIASMLPDIDKILYLDGDIIVNSNIKELFDTDIENYYIGAIPEVYNHNHKERLDIIGDEYYINAGVLLINCKKWREDNIEEKLFRYAIQPEREIVFQDQDILNEVLKYNIKYLPLQWNLQHDALFTDESYLYHKDERIEAVNSPKLIHFTHKFKPWNSKCTNKYRKLFYEYLKQTPWKDEYNKLLFSLILKNISNFFYQKKYEHNNTVEKIKIFRITFHKKVEKRYEVKKYFLGIKYSQKLDKKRLIWERGEEILSSVAKFKHEFLIQKENINRQLEKLIDDVYTNTSHALSIYNLHQKVFPKYKNINSGKDIVLVATGPSLQNYIPIENAVHIGVNRAFQNDKVNFDYLFIQDYSGSTKDYIDEFIRYKEDTVKKFIGYLNYNLEQHCIIPDKYSNYKNIERYYNVHPLIKKNFTYDIASEPLADSYSIAFPAMQFALWTNPKRIYLVGCDCNNNGHFDKQTNVLAVDSVIDGWKRIKEFAKIYYPDTEIISINPVGLKGIFKEEYTTEKGVINV